jgi:antitoxin HicB
MNFEYPMTITSCDEGGYFVQFVDIEEAFTQGESIEECVFNAAEVLSAILECRLENNDEIPEPSKGDYEYKVPPTASIQAALLIRATRQDKTIAEVARALNTSWPAAQRLENPKHSPTLRQLERAVNALGKRLVLSVTD